MPALPSRATRAQPASSSPEELSLLTLMLSLLCQAVAFEPLAQLGFKWVGLQQSGHSTHAVHLVGSAGAASWSLAATCCTAGQDNTPYVSPPAMCEHYAGQCMVHLFNRLGMLQQVGLLGEGLCPMHKGHYIVMVNRQSRCPHGGYSRLLPCAWRPGPTCTQQPLP
jgi:hypothetical protein